jgi:hypothetical protein
MVRVLALLATVLFACDNGSKPAPPDLAYPSSCGFPGDDPLNDLGVGKFCQDVSTGECSGNGKAGLCSYLGDPTSHFCTFICSRNDPPGVCGPGAVCVCNSQGCGCTPIPCAPPGDGGV